MDWLVGHLVGDYLVQNDWMALNKKKSDLHCLVHVLSYTLCVWACTLWPWWTLPLVAIPHYLIDRTQFVMWFMRVTGKEKFAQPPMSPWSLIAVDNTFHAVCLWLTALLVQHRAAVQNWF